MKSGCNILLEKNTTTRDAAPAGPPASVTREGPAIRRHSLQRNVCSPHRGRAQGRKTRQQCSLPGRLSVTGHANHPVIRFAPILNGRIIKKTKQNKQTNKPSFSDTCTKPFSNYKQTCLRLRSVRVSRSSVLDTPSLRLQYRGSGGPTRAADSWPSASLYDQQHSGRELRPPQLSPRRDAARTLGASRRSRGETRGASWTRSEESGPAPLRTAARR